MEIESTGGFFRPNSEKMEAVLLGEAAFIRLVQRNGFIGPPPESHQGLFHQMDNIMEVLKNIPKYKF